jgi:hypothetical protein
MDASFIARDLYLLLAILAASREICLRRENEDDQSSVYGHRVRVYELPEVGGLFVSLAAGSVDDRRRPETNLSDIL